jgi:hypothetical protein
MPYFHPSKCPSFDSTDFERQRCMESIYSFNKVKGVEMLQSWHFHKCPEFDSTPWRIFPMKKHTVKYLTYSVSFTINRVMTVP